MNVDQKLLETVFPIAIMAIENSVLSTFVDGINVFNCHLSGVIMFPQRGRWGDIRVGGYIVLVRIPSASASALASAFSFPCIIF